LENSATGRTLSAFTPARIRDHLIELAVSKNMEQPPAKLLERLEKSASADTMKLNPSSFEVLLQ
jgi:hypothetical protein